MSEGLSPIETHRSSLRDKFAQVSQTLFDGTYPDAIYERLIDSLVNYQTELTSLGDEAWMSEKLREINSKPVTEQHEIESL